MTFRLRPGRLELVNQLLVDITRYEKHPGCKTLITLAEPRYRTSGCWKPLRFEIEALSDFATDGSLFAKDSRHHGFGFFFFDGLQGFLSRANLEFAESILDRFEVLR